MTVPSVPILTQSWHCPNCGLTEQTRMLPNRFHHCPVLKMLAPLVRQGVKAKVERRDREDYVNGELVQTDDDGRPVMSVVTTRDDGQDVMVFAPTATAKGRGYDANR